MIIPELVDAGPMKGSGGSVRRATQQVNSIDTLVAIKTSATGKERTSAEAAAAVEIDLLSSELVGCCGVVQLLSAWKCSSGGIWRVHLVLELGQRDLFDVVQKEPKQPGRGLPEDRVTAFMVQILRAVTACHQVGVAHRDIKLENIMMMPDGTLKLIDFGLSCRFGDRSSQPTTGTPGYLAPEYVAHFMCELEQTSLSALELCSPSLSELEQTSRQSLVSRDLWACGIALVLMALARQPWGHGSMARPACGPYRKHQLGKESPSSLLLSPKLRELCDALLDVDPLQRGLASNRVLHKWL